MSAPETSRFVRLRVDLVLEVEEASAVTGAALARLAGDAELPAAERSHAEATVSEDTAEAIAYLVDPFDLVGEVPGVELHQASWSSELIAYDPDAPEWAGEDDDEADEPYERYADYAEADDGDDDGDDGEREDAYDAYVEDDEDGAVHDSDLYGADGDGDEDEGRGEGAGAGAGAPVRAARG
ncbi:hypothetical protein [Streptomyces sp. NPDC088789]|uniref:hypothetical protein n=1 Tax=Streptomyces sp. NPDC088789 TaxID=3365899 RepID=UPI0037F1FA7B